jgi:transposase
MTSIEERLPLLEREICDLRAENALLKAREKGYLERIAELERRLSLDSSNSSKPPSSDGLKKPPAVLRTESVRNQYPKIKTVATEKPEGVTLGVTLAQSATPDVTVFLPPLNQCPCCAKDISSIKSKGLVKRQVFDIPEPKIEVTEYHGEYKTCSCGKTVTNFPDTLQAPAQWGARIKATAVYLSNQHFVPEKRLNEILQDLYGAPVSTKSLASFTQKAAETLKEDDQARLKRLKVAAVKHVDETGVRVAGKLGWCHSLSTSTETHYRVAARGEVLEDMEGIVTHDFWGSYLGLKVQHAFCNIHLIRELTAVAKIDKDAWANRMRRLFWLGWRAKVLGKTDRYKVRLKALYDQIAAEGLRYYEGLPPLEGKPSENGGTKPPPKRKGHNLVLRLLKYKDGILRYLDNPAVPFTNNQAERDVRMVKVKQKISGSFRTVKGAEDFCVIRGFLSTKRKQKENLFEALLPICA